MTLESPGPDSDQIREMVEIAARVPDHGKLAPWRFVVWSSSLRKAMHASLIELLEAHPDLMDKEKLAKGTDKLLHAPCVIAVISTASEHPKIPVWEQTLSAGASCMNLLHAANALGFEAQWLTAWYIYEDQARDILRLSDSEQIAGIVHIGSSSIPKAERPRPDLDTILSFVSE
ncbi:nitroreductase [Pseudahrensia aquimaris]|uniref:Putative NAD(P)H nitroreductase n=1 Tax=Pseudahrensia aquimaris TaxID=744461 RepID=A0ABW3FF57_9HYPH